MGASSIGSSDLGYANYWIKTFGSTLADCRFHKLPRVVQRAKRALPEVDIVGFLICAIERSPKMTGLMFCDSRHAFPHGLPAHTPPIVRRFQRKGYLIVQADTGGLFVVAHWYFENGAVGPFDLVH